MKNKCVDAGRKWCIQNAGEKFGPCWKYRKYRKWPCANALMGISGISSISGTLIEIPKAYDSKDHPAFGAANTEAKIMVERTAEQEQWLEARKEAARHIDPDTAEVEWIYAQTLDPYGIYPDLPDELWQVGREYFARAPGSDVWVSFSDLPAPFLNALRQRELADVDEIPF